MNTRSAVATASSSWASCAFDKESKTWTRWSRNRGRKPSSRSGLDSKPTGSASFGYGSFRSPTGEVNLGGNSWLHRFYLDDDDTWLHLNLTPGTSIELDMHLARHDLRYF